MTNAAIRARQLNGPEILLVDSMDQKNQEDRSWFRELLESILWSTDMDLSQFERLENKRSRHQIEIERWY